MKMRMRMITHCYLDAGVAGLRLGLDADVSPAVLLPIPARVVSGVSVLVGDDGRDGLRRVGLDEEPVQRGRGALRDGGGLVRGVGLVRVSAVDHPALRDVDTGSAAHSSAVPEPEPEPEPARRGESLGYHHLPVGRSCLHTAGGFLRASAAGSPPHTSV